jgi:predicted phage tail protein
LSRPWLEVAACIGPRRFLEVWRLLDREELIEQEGRLRLSIPRFRQYLRYQRNRYIQALAADGHSAPEIAARLKRQLGERISIKHISRLMKG